VSDPRAASLTLDPAFTVGDVDPRLYGSFVEHMGRAVYGGIYEPGHPTADERGFRQDVLELVRELGVPLVRYPGGNFVSGYNWEDGIGPVEARPRRLDLAWRTVEPNTVGIDEFAAWARRAQVEPMLAVNLGTRGIDAARNLLEYCNHPAGTYWSDLRVKHGATEPYGIRLWCLGNEMDGAWQIGHKTADEYGRLANETGRAMRILDPSIELVACGSSNSEMPTYPAWEATVLDHTYEVVDYLALHNYYTRRDGGLPRFMASALDMDDYIRSVIATCDYVKAKQRSRKTMMLAFDEWNVWHHREFELDQQPRWMSPPPLLEDDFTLAEAVVVGSLLITLLRHADRVRIACLAQLTNVIAPIRTLDGGPAWRQAIFHPFKHAATWGHGTVLRVEPASPTYEVEGRGPVPLLDAVATVDPEGGDVTLFAVNRGLDEALRLDADVRALGGAFEVEHVVLTGDDPHAVNTPDQPDRVHPTPAGGAEVRDGRLTATLPRLSWNVIRLRRP
jgi:alpha-L-arabinofuranosidase